MPKNPTVCRVLAILDSYHDFGRVSSGAAAQVQYFSNYVDELLKGEAQAICRQKGITETDAEPLSKGKQQPNNFYEALGVHAYSSFLKDYEGFTMDLFSTHYFVGGKGLYVSKTDLKTGKATGKATGTATDSDKETSALISASDKRSAQDIIKNSALPATSSGSGRGAMTILVFNKDVKESDTKRKLYEFLCDAYRTKRMQYYLDAEPISPTDLCALGSDNAPVANGIFYNGIGRMYDPGNSSGIFVNDAILGKAASCDQANGNSENDGRGLGLSPVQSAQSAPNMNLTPLVSEKIPSKKRPYARAAIDALVNEAPCYFSPSRSYSLSKAEGELLFFDKLVFGDKCPPNPKTIDIIAVLGKKRVPLNSLSIVKLTNSQNGIKHYMAASGNVVKAAIKAKEGGISSNQRKKILTDIQTAAYRIILSAFRLAYEPRFQDGTKPIVSKTKEGNLHYTLGARDYSMALLDLKRSGDYGLVASAAAATLAMNSADTVPIVVTHDRMAAMYALYRGVACMYVLNKDGRFVKIFNFDRDSLAAAMPRFSDAPAAAGGAFAIGSPARAAAARPVTRASSRFAPVAAPAARPSTAPVRPSESARRRAPALAPADRQNAPPPPRLAVRAEPPEFADAPGAPNPEFAKTRFPPFAKFADMLADLARGDPDSAELLSPVNMLTYSFLHHYLRRSDD